jgi:hypothetical protein
MLMIAWLCSDKDHRRPWLWTVVLVSLFCVILLAGIRFPARVAYPLLLMLMLAPLAGMSQTESHHGETGFSRKAFLFAILVPLGWVAWGDNQAHRSNLSNRNIVSHSVETGFQDLSRDRPGSIFVPVPYRGYSATNYVRPFHFEAPPSPIPSGWMAQSPIKNSYLEMNGFDPGHKFVPQLLVRKNVVYYFLATKSDSSLFVLEPFFSYLNRHYGDGASVSKLTPRMLKVEKAGSYYWWFFQVEGVES